MTSARPPSSPLGGFAFWASVSLLSLWPKICSKSRHAGRRATTFVSSGVAYRARCRPPSYIHLAVFPYLIVGHQVSDVVAVLGSLNIIAAELDR